MKRATRIGVTCGMTSTCDAGNVDGRHARVGAYPVLKVCVRRGWIPACAGMTHVECGRDGRRRVRANAQKLRGAISNQG